jgi:hypothetical protein
LVLTTLKGSGSSSMVMETRSFLEGKQKENDGAK